MTDEERFFYNHGYKQAERDFIKKLEKIKIKFEQYRDGWNYYGNEYEKTKYETYDVCVDEIDERISELKGENNG